MALGAQVMKKFGISGFYTSSLFEFDQRNNLSLEK